MKAFLAASAAIITAVSAHSWVECANHDNSEILGWMKGNSTLNPPVIIDPAMPWYSYMCTGWPRNKANPGNWIDESTNYVWNIAANSWNGGSYHPADTHACPANQRTPTYQSNAPMPTAAPGSMIRLLFGGNGHTRGYNAGFAAGPGNVTVYWKGAPEQEITDISEFTPENALQTNGFSEDSFSYPADPSITSPTQGLVDKGNWMELHLPSNMAPGRHMMVWVWSYSNNGNYAPQWSTCFDVMISGAAQSPPQSSPSPAPAPAPAAPVASPPAASSPAASSPAASSPAAPAYVAPAAPAVVPSQAVDIVSNAPAPSLPSPTMPVYEGAATTVTDWTTVWTTDWVIETDAPSKHKRHPRAFRI